MHKKNVSRFGLTAAAALVLLLTACAPTSAAALAEAKLQWVTFGESGNAFVYTRADSDAVYLAIKDVGDFATGDTSSAAGCFSLLYNPNIATRVPEFYCNSVRGIQ